MSGITHYRYDCLAALLEYPLADFPDRLDACLAIAWPAAEVAELLRPFAAALHALTPVEREELFTGTFDLDPVCALEVGWQLFGEDYARGAFLVKMREELRRHGLPEAGELPDHLSHVLRICARMTPPERGARFADDCIQPGLERMLQALDGRDNPYELLLQAVRAALPAGEPVEEVVDGR